MANVITIGEIMIRMQAPGHERLSRSQQFTTHIGGAELNVAIGLSHLGHEVNMLSALPENNPLSVAILLHLCKHGVKDQWIRRDGERIGLYFAEAGYSDRPGQVIYDRKHSAIQILASSSFDWDAVYKDQDWLHVSGVTPAISPELKEYVITAVQEANKRQVQVSFDFNFRSKMWSQEAAKESYQTILPYVDHCFAGWKDFVWLFGWEPQGETLKEQLSFFHERLRSEYDVRSISTMHREVKDAGRHELTGYYDDGKKLYEGVIFQCDVVDRIGGGDSYAAGILHGIMNKKKPEDLLAFAVGLSVLNHFEHGDNTGFTEEEVQAYLNNQTGDVSR